MNKRSLVIAAILVIAIGLIAWWSLGRRDFDRETAVAERGSIDVTIETVGSIAATDAARIRSRVTGVVASVGAHSGDRVIEGDIIIFLDHASFDERIEQVEQQLQDAEYVLQLSETRLQDDPKNVALRLEVLSAAQRVREAGTLLDNARESRRSVAIVAPQDGTLIELNSAVGELISENQHVATIAAPADLTLVADVDELDLPNIEPGASVRFRLDAFPASELDGVVDTTAAQALAQGGATVFPTVIRFEYPDDLDIRAGMNADVTIVTDARDNVLLVPERALRTVGDRAFVDIIIEGSSEEREVQLGYRGQGSVEIVAGLTDGDIVALQ